MAGVVLPNGKLVQHFTCMYVVGVVFLASNHARPSIFIFHVTSWTQKLTMHGLNVQFQVGLLLAKKEILL